MASTHIGLDLIALQTASAAVGDFPAFVAIENFEDVAVLGEFKAVFVWVLAEAPEQSTEAVRLSVMKTIAPSLGSLGPPSQVSLASLFAVPVAGACGAEGVGGVSLVFCADANDVSNSNVSAYFILFIELDAIAAPLAASITPPEPPPHSR